MKTSTSGAAYSSRMKQLDNLGGGRGTDNLLRQPVARETATTGSLAIMSHSSVVGNSPGSKRQHAASPREPEDTSEAPSLQAFNWGKPAEGREVTRKASTQADS